MLLIDHPMRSCWSDTLQNFYVCINTCVDGFFNLWSLAKLQSGRLNLFLFFIAIMFNLVLYALHFSFFLLLVLWCISGMVSLLIQGGGVESPSDWNLLIMESLPLVVCFFLGSKPKSLLFLLITNVIYFKFSHLFFLLLSPH